MTKQTQNQCQAECLCILGSHTFVPIGWSFQKQTPVSPRSVISPHSGGEVVALCTIIHYLSVPRVTRLVETRRSPTVAVPSVDQASYTVKSALTNIPSFLLPKFLILLLWLSLQTDFSYDKRDWIGVFDQLCLQQDRFVSPFSHMFQNIFLFLSSFLFVLIIFPASLVDPCVSLLIVLSHVFVSLVLRMLQRITT